MAGKGGGSWKVAYADFVTAMMAFFLVMWLGSQDQKVKQSVANYFVDPSGAAKKPARTGATFNSITYGGLPQAEAVAMGRGRNSYSQGGEMSQPTKVVGDWIHADEKARVYWKEQAIKARDQAAGSADVRAKRSTAEEVAARELSKQMQSELHQSVPQTKGLYQDLLYGTLAEVNWTELATDLLAQ